jgi:hypothetical protein
MDAPVKCYRAVFEARGGFIVEFQVLDVSPTRSADDDVRAISRCRYGRIAGLSLVAATTAST